MLWDLSGYLLPHKSGGLARSIPFTCPKSGDGLLLKCRIGTSPIFKSQQLDELISFPRTREKIPDMVDLSQRTGQMFGSLGR
jgi:hypothetical protein